jgi:hypothetical protein
MELPRCLPLWMWLPTQCRLVFTAASDIKNFRAFWRELMRRFQKNSTCLVEDNYSAHKMPKVKRWFTRRPSYHLHFTPTSASWSESSGASLWSAHGVSDSARYLHPRAGTGVGDPRLCHPSQSKSQGILHMHRPRRLDSQECPLPRFLLRGIMLRRAAVWARSPSVTFTEMLL